VKPGLINPQTWAKVAPRRKVFVGLVVFAILQVLDHFGTGPAAIGLEGWLVEALATFGAMWLVREPRKVPVVVVPVVAGESESSHHGHVHQAK
jgi:hypothetical protein